MKKFAVLAGAAIMGFAVSPAWAQDDKEAAIKAGETVFAQCRACHQVGPTAKNTVGPILNGLFGRVAGTVEGYNYSEANKKSGITWDEKVFAEYIENPRAKMPGTKMAYAGLKDPKRIENLIAYLKNFDKDGKPPAK
jgi:cytochrome c